MTICFRFMFDKLSQNIYISLMIVKSSTSRFRGPEDFKNSLVCLDSSLMNEVIGPLISHFEHSYFRLAQTIESLKICGTLISLRFGGKLLKSLHQTLEKCDFGLILGSQLYTSNIRKTRKR